MYLQGTDFLDMKENERVEQIYTFKRLQARENHALAPRSGTTLNQLDAKLNSVVTWLLPFSRACFCIEF